MKLIVFGATGGTGQEVLRQALAAGHQVTAFVRNPAKVALEHENLLLVQGDVIDVSAVEQAVAGHEAVISTLGPTRPPIKEMMQTAARNITAAMQKNGIRRLISTTGAGVRAPEDEPQLIDRVMKGLLTVMAGEVLRDSEANARLIAASGLDWTIVRVPRLVDGAMTGKYRVGYLGKGSGIMVARADVADFILKEVAKSEYVGKMPVISS